MLGVLGLATTLNESQAMEKPCNLNQTVPICSETLEPLLDNTRSHLGVTSLSTSLMTLFKNATCFTPCHSLHPNSYIPYPPLFQPHPCHMETRRSRIKSEPHLWPKPLLRQHWILNLLCWAGDWTGNSTETSWIIKLLCHSWKFPFVPFLL